MNNIVSISIDDLVSFQAFRNHFPDILSTPNIDRLAAMGVSFDNAFAQVAICNPSRTSILTGLRPEETGVHSNNVPWYETVSMTRTLPYILAESGFDTSVIGKVYHQPADNLPNAGNLPFTTFSDEFGWDSDYAPIPGPSGAGPFNFPQQRHGDYVNTTEAIRQVEGWDADGGNALFLGIYRPHGPFTAPQEFFDLYPLSSIPLPERLDTDLSDIPPFMRQLVNSWFHEDVVEAGAWKPLLQAYFAGISFADAQVGRLLDALEDEGRLDDTSIVLWSDHGYHLGEKETWHKFTLWEEAARAPLIIYDPERPAAGRHIQTPVELLDIMPTVLDMLDMPAPSELQGKSLTSFLTHGSVPTQGTAFTTMHGSMAIRTANFRFIIYEDNSTELYDIVNDPNQYDNLSGEAAYAGTQAALRVALLNHAQENGWVRAVGVVDLSGSTEDHTVVFPNPAGEVLGGTGDDVYFVRSQNPNIVEQANGGTDTIFFRSSVQLPEHVENASRLRERSASANVEVVGNAASNTIIHATRVWGMAGDDVIRLTSVGFGYGGSGNDNIEGWDNADLLDGGAGNDILSAGAGTDRLLGMDGADTMRGETGGDTLAGGAGADVLIGGVGNDVFDFDRASDSAPGARDTIRSGFGDGQVAFLAPGPATGDKLDLRGVDANETLAGDQTFGYGTARTTGRLWAVESGTNTIVRGNVDGDTAPEFEVLIVDGAGVAASAYGVADFFL